MLTSHRASSKRRPSTQTEILWKVNVAVLLQQNHTKISQVNFQVFSYKCDKPNYNVAVADRNQRCVVEKESRKYLRQILSQ